MNGISRSAEWLCFTSEDLKERIRVMKSSCQIDDESSSWGGVV